MKSGIARVALAYSNVLGGAPGEVWDGGATESGAVTT